MLVRRAVIVAVLLLLAVLIEVTVLAPLPFPGATPSLVLVVVVILASQFGASTGAVSGFAGGLLLDIAPPAAGTIGITAPRKMIATFASKPRPRSTMMSGMKATRGVAARAMT